MKKLLLYYGFLIYLSGAPILCSAQATQDQLRRIRSSVIEKIDGKEFYIHTILRGQTLYMISKAYGVEINDIIRENPKVKEGIKADQKIRIPIPGKKTEIPEEKPEIPTHVKDSADKASLPENAPTISDSLLQISTPCGKDSKSKKNTYNVALMLPLYLDNADHLNVENPEPDILETFISFKFLPFYEGFRIALDSLEKTGLKVVLWVYDVDKDTVKTQQLLRKPEMKLMDLIIGLLYHRNFLMVADFARKNKINIVNPISERSDIVTGNPLVFKVKPAKSQLNHQVAEYLADVDHDAQVLIVRNGKYSDPGAVDQLKKACLEQKLNVQVVDGQDALMTRMSKEKENWIVAFTDNTTYALEFTRQLYRFRNDYKISLIGLPFWSNLEGLETDYLVGLKTHMVVPYFTDYENTEVKKFVQRYQLIYHADPSPLAFDGYDVAIYFLSALKNYGKNIRPCLDELKIPLLQTQYDYHYSKNNGSENLHWEIYKYENYKLLKAN
jgi:ABC-type branched-subunit amino acid transport system substrate-binding protein/LysM repeat protein